MHRPRILAVVMMVAGGCAIVGAEAPPPPPVVFEGFGLGDLSGAASVSRALRAAAVAGPAAEGPEFDVVVRGPKGTPTEPMPPPLAAEVRGRIEGFDVAAGFQGDARALAERTPRWTGTIGLGTEGPDGGETLELRTRLESRGGAGRLGLEIGPRIERRLPRGVRFFIDGAATAEAVRAAPEEGWQLPGTSTADSAAAVGLSARTGIVR